MSICSGIYKSWQGIVEIILRGISLGVLVLVVICAGVSASLLSSITFFDDEAERLRYWGNAAAIYTVVVSIISLILEGAILIIRFFDINSIIFHIVDIIISFGIALGHLAAAIPITVYLPNIQRIVIVVGDSSIKDRLAAAAEATDVFAFMAVIFFSVLGSFMILSILCKWKNTSRYSGPGGKAGTV